MPPEEPPKPPEPPKTPPAPPPAEPTLKDLLTQIASMSDEIKSLKGKKDDPNETPELREKAKLERENKDKDSARTKRLESSISFNLRSKDFIKANETLLPKDVSDIFAQAEKENYADAIEKDSAIKAGIIQSFFSIQSNMELLTPGLKSNIDEYLKLTKNGKQDKAQEVYDTIFEPAFEMLKRTKKAEALSKGYGTDNNAENAYKNKMQTLSRKHYLGEK